MRHESDRFIEMSANRANPSVPVRRTEPRPDGAATGRSRDRTEPRPDGAATARERYLRYLITFACYGGRLHGDESGSVDRDHNLVGSRLVQPDPERMLVERGRMLQKPYVLDEHSRAAVLAALRRHCGHRGWHLLAAHVRSNHVHAVVEAEVRPEKIMNEFKSYASRELNRLGPDGSDRRRWARHGSTRWLWKDQDVQNAIQYVVEEQGEPMALFIADEF